MISIWDRTKPKNVLNSEKQSRFCLRTDMNSLSYYKTVGTSIETGKKLVWSYFKTVKLNHSNTAYKLFQRIFACMINDSERITEKLGHCTEVPVPYVGCWLGI